MYSSVMKVHSTINVDENVLKRAKERGLNLSGEVENMLRKRLDVKEVIISDKCDFCGKAMRKATRDDQKGLIWLFPDEKWICYKCFKNKSDKIIKGLQYV